MGIKNITILICDRCGRELDVSVKGNVPLSGRWQTLGDIVFCPDDANAFHRFMRGGAAKAVKAA